MNTVQYIKVYTGADHRLAGVREPNYRSFSTLAEAQDFAVQLADQHAPGNSGSFFVHNVQVLGESK